jgi:hypothetical protein
MSKKNMKTRNVNVFTTWILCKTSSETLFGADKEGV